MQGHNTLDALFHARVQPTGKVLTLAANNITDKGSQHEQDSRHHRSHWVQVHKVGPTSGKSNIPESWRSCQHVTSSQQ